MSSGEEPLGSCTTIACVQRMMTPVLRVIRIPEPRSEGANAGARRMEPKAGR